MGQVLHGSATTTEVISRAIQHGKESLRALASRHGVNQKTVAKWRKRLSTADPWTRPKEARSTTLTIEEEAVIVAFRRHTLLPLNGIVEPDNDWQLARRPSPPADIHDRDAVPGLIER